MNTTNSNYTAATVVSGSQVKDYMEAEHLTTQARLTTDELISMIYRLLKQNADLAGKLMEVENKK